MEQNMVTPSLSGLDLDILMHLQEHPNWSELRASFNKITEQSLRKAVQDLIELGYVRELDNGAVQNTKKGDQAVGDHLAKSQSPEAAPIDEILAEQGAMMDTRTVTDGVTSPEQHVMESLPYNTARVVELVMMARDEPEVAENCFEEAINFLRREMYRVCNINSEITFTPE